MYKLASNQVSEDVEFTPVCYTNNTSDAGFRIPRPSDGKLWMVAEEVCFLTSRFIGRTAYTCVLSLKVVLSELVSKCNGYLLQKNGVDVVETPFRITEDPDDSKHTFSFDSGANPAGISIRLVQPPRSILFADFSLYGDCCIMVVLIPFPEFSNGEFFAFGEIEPFPDDLCLAQITMDGSHLTGYSRVGWTNSCVRDRSLRR